MVVPLLAGDPRIQLTYAAFVMFKANFTLAAAATGKENTRGGGEGGRVKVHVEMRERYCVRRFIVISIEKKVFADKGDPTQYNLFHRIGPCRFYRGLF